MVKTTSSTSLNSNIPLFWLIFSDIDGALQVRKILNFTDGMNVKDLKRGYVSEVNIIPTKQKSMLGGLFGKKQADNVPQAINQVLIAIKHNGQVVAHGK